MLLTTPRLTLTPFHPADADALHHLYLDPDVRRYLWDDVQVPRERVVDVIHRSQQSWQQHGYGHWALRLVDGDSIIGSVGLFTADGSPGVELLYSLLPNHWGQGLATEAARAALRFAFEQAHLPEVWARTDRPNHASHRLMQRLGMRDVTAPHEQYLTCVLRYAHFHPNASPPTRNP